MRDSQLVAGVGIVGGIIFLTIILVSSSIGKLEYYEMGFSRNKVTGTVNRKKVYAGGTHFVGLAKNFVKFPSIAIATSLEDLSVYTASSELDAGTPAVLDVNFQYLLVQDELIDLYEATNINYRPYIRNIAIDKVKNIAPKFTADEYLEDRITVEQEMREELKMELRNVHVDVIDMQLLGISFPPAFITKKLNTAIQDERNAAEQFKKNATVIRGETSKQVKYIENDVLLTTKTADANSVAIQANATHKATRVFEDARTDAVYDFVDTLDITDTQQILSVDLFFRLLKQQNNIVMGADQNLLLSV